MRIALDAMGGDFAPEPNIHGAIAALIAQPELEVVLVGDPAVLDSIIQSSGYSGERLTVHAAEGFVGMEEKPTDALRKKPNCSIAVCWKLMAGREVEAVVSAGNTGAVVAAGLRTRLFLPGVKRPGIAVALPTLRGRTLLLDVGANPAARPEHLYQYGVMGQIFAREIMGIAEPRVGLMNIGSEDGKGNDLYRETHSFLVSSSLRHCYIGNVEGRGLYQGEADVVICEGFVGNVVLKVSEGMADFMMKAISGAVLGALQNEKEHALTALKKLAKSYEHHEEGGAPLLGIDGVCMICHGSSNARSIENALKRALAFKDSGLNAIITQALAQRPEDSDAAVRSA
ncbi:MAG: phosphate acyltransferase PlsX [Planctomycetaceae bacterium]